MAVKVGDAIPDVSLRAVTATGVQTVSTRAFCKGKKVVLFAVPGAFTPTCSAQHLPGFVAKAQEFKAQGVDEIACISVNDHFVMDAWAKAQNVGGKLILLADGNGEFAQAMGLPLDGSGFGLGTRSQRYAAVIEDGIVRKLAVEQPSKFEVSSAEAMLKEL
jgi:glutaredoxin/glutathione-dependent peroxiredoxin